MTRLLTLPLLAAIIFCPAIGLSQTTNQERDERVIQLRSSSNQLETVTQSPQEKPAETVTPQQLMDLPDPN